eukprot:11196593-Prorocentrum_lima.AAC.1
MIRRPPRSTLVGSVDVYKRQSLQFSGNEWGATRGTVVLANDLPGSHDLSLIHISEPTRLDVI